VQQEPRSRPALSEDPGPGAGNTWGTAGMTGQASSSSLPIALLTAFATGLGLVLLGLQPGSPSDRCGPANIAGALSLIGRAPQDVDALVRRLVALTSHALWGGGATRCRPQHSLAAAGFSGSSPGGSRPGGMAVPIVGVIKLERQGFVLRRDGHGASCSRPHGRHPGIGFAFHEHLP